MRQALQGAFRRLFECIEPHLYNTEGRAYATPQTLGIGVCKTIHQRLTEFLDELEREPDLLRERDRLAKGAERENPSDFEAGSAFIRRDTLIDENNLQWVWYALKRLEETSKDLPSCTQKCDAEDSESTSGNANPANLRPCDRKAWSQHVRAKEKNPDLDTDRSVYDWYLEHELDEGEKLPTFATWMRYLRKCRVVFGEQKNKRGVGAETRSVVRAKEI